MTATRGMTAARGVPADGLEPLERVGRFSASLLELTAGEAHTEASVIAVGLSSASVEAYVGERGLSVLERGESGVEAVEDLGERGRLDPVLIGEAGERVEVERIGSGHRPDRLARTRRSRSASWHHTSNGPTYR